jgi:DNA polymerase
MEADFAAALAWWRESGVDYAFADAALPWLAAPEPEPAAPAAETMREAPPPRPAPPRIGGNPEDWPGDLAAFDRWWLEEPTLGPIAGRVPPRGPAGAELMVLVCEPEAEDGAELLSGPRGLLLAGMLRAMAISPESVRLASVLPRPVPAPDWGEMGAAGLGGIIAHHLALAKPARVIAFGSPILPLLGHDPAQTAPFLQSVNHGAGSVPLELPVLPARDLAYLDRPGARRQFWNAWLDWTR